MCISIKKCRNLHFYQGFLGQPQGTFIPSPDFQYYSSCNKKLILHRWVCLCVCVFGTGTIDFPCLNKPLGDTWPSYNGLQGLGHHPHLDPLPRKGRCEYRLAKNQLIDQNQQKVSCSPEPFREPGVLHLWFPNCPDTSRSRTFCNSFIWFLFGIICPFSSVCSKVFHITSDILNFHISCTIFIIFSWAITFWKQITFLFFKAFWKQPQKDAWKECQEIYVAILSFKYKTELI